MEKITLGSLRLEPFPGRSALTPPRLSAGRNGRVTLSRAAATLLDALSPGGRTDAVIILFDHEKRTLGLRPEAPGHPHAYNVRRGPGGAATVNAGAALRHFGVDTPCRFQGCETHGGVLTATVAGGRT